MIQVSSLVYIVGFIAMFFIRIPSFILIILGLGSIGLFTIGKKKYEQPKFILAFLLILVLVLVLKFIQSKVLLADPNFDMSPIVEYGYYLLGVYIIANLLSYKKQLKA